MAVYLDSSAIVKLVVHEKESGALRRTLRRRAIRVSSALARVEVLRHVGAHGQDAWTRASEVLERIRLIEIDRFVLDEAATLRPDILRSLDAIHLASARILGADCEAIVTYDSRMIEGAKILGLAVRSPS